MKYNTKTQQDFFVTADKTLKFSWDDFFMLPGNSSLSLPTHLSGSPRLAIQSEMAQERGKMLLEGKTKGIQKTLNRQYSYSCDTESGECSASTDTQFLTTAPKANLYNLNITLCLITS